MRVITLNTNGIRSAAKKGLFEWLLGEAPDVVCIQETKAQEHQLVDTAFWPDGYHTYYHDAEKPGYSGVALFCRRQPDEVIRGIGWADMDREGRYLEARFGNLSIVSIYVPSGSSSPERQSVKFSFLDRLGPFLKTCKDSGREYHRS